MDILNNYKSGLNKLLQQLSSDHPRYSDVLVYQQRMSENIARVRRFGDNETYRVERAEIVDGLNQLVLTVAHVSFNELCNLATIDDFQQAYTTLRQVVPKNSEALNQLTHVLHQLGHFHEQLNEWKELHNLVQECITALIPLKFQLEFEIDNPKHRKISDTLKLWGECRGRLRHLENFSREIRYIDKPFSHNSGISTGPYWMIQIVALRDNFEICLEEGNPKVIYNSALELWDACYEILYKADKCLRDMVGELYALSNAILRGLE